MFDSLVQKLAPAQHDSRVAEASQDVRLHSGPAGCDVSLEDVRSAGRRMLSRDAVSSWSGGEVCGTDGTVCARARGTRRQVFTVDGALWATLEGTFSDVSSFGLQLLVCRSQQVCIGPLHAVGVKAPRRGPLTLSFPERVSKVLWHPDGTAFLTSGTQCLLWDRDLLPFVGTADATEEVGRAACEIKSLDDSVVCSLDQAAFSHDGTFLVAVRSESGVQRALVWKVCLKPLRVECLQRTALPPGLQVVRVRFASSKSIAFISDKSILFHTFGMVPRLPLGPMVQRIGFPINVIADVTRGSSPTLFVAVDNMLLWSKVSLPLQDFKVAELPKEVDSVTSLVAHVDGDWSLFALSSNEGTTFCHVLSQSEKSGTGTVPVAEEGAEGDPEIKAEAPGPKKAKNADPFTQQDFIKCARYCMSAWEDSSAKVLETVREAARANLEVRHPLSIGNALTTLNDASELKAAAERQDRALRVREPSIKIKENIERESRRWWHGAVDKVTVKLSDSNGKSFMERLVTAMQEEAPLHKPPRQPVDAQKELTTQLAALGKELTKAQCEAGLLKNAVDASMRDASIAWGSDERIKGAVLRIREVSQADTLISSLSETVASAVKEATRSPKLLQGGDAVGTLSASLLARLQPDMQPLKSDLQRLTDDTAGTCAELASSSQEHLREARHQVSLH